MMSSWNDIVNNQSEQQRIIQLLNQKCDLSTLLNKLTFEISDNFSGWTHKSICPFSDHQDKSPSFFFNPQKNIFNCFGCHRGGGPVQFYAFYYSKDIEQAIKELSKNKSLIEDIQQKIIEDDSAAIFDLLISFSTKIRSFLNQNSIDDEILLFINNLTWNIDLYLEKNLSNRTLNLENLKFRIEKLTEILDHLEN